MSKHLSMTHARARSFRGGAIVLGAAAIGVGVLASPASADHYDWTGVAQCESGGNWSINTGNGYYGGLEFRPPAGVGHRRGVFAARGDPATPGGETAGGGRALYN